MFTFLGSAEKAGSGADKIIHGWEKQNWKRPYISERSRPNKVILTLSMESLLDENVKNALAQLFGERVNTLPQPQLTTLALAYSEEEITNERLQYALDIHRADITKMLSDMCANKLLQSSGHGRGTKYHIYGTNVSLPTANMALNMDTSEANMALPTANMALPTANMALPTANMALPTANMALPKRYTKEQLRSKVKEVCKEWSTADEIAIKIGRDTKYVKNFVLPLLSDVLEKMYDVPRHPRQKYKVKAD